MMKGMTTAALATALLAGCGGNRALVGKQTMIESMPGSRPDWVGKSSYEAGGRIYYRGGVTGRSDMALALREARAEGEKQLAEQIKQRIRTEFGSAIEGQNVDGDTGSYVRDLIAKTSENVEVSGVTASEQYVQKLEERTSTGVRYVWDAYALVSLPREDYLEARRKALQGALAEARQARNQKAESSLKEAFTKLAPAAPASTGMAVSTESAAAH